MVAKILISRGCLTDGFMRDPSGRFQLPNFVSLIQVGMGKFEEDIHSIYQGAWSDEK